ncbi:hypothetical protein F3Y22_tig00111342pilonHSYRG00183 [Hibiscus syriacus]|uniref:DUF641 domain-containing protein n=1 Tax=Hibiscus syriacus TaxID=106335 RepID=A0A6A2YPB3_HIBSY|nr:hypothetical protein F3Y22_tig00111342pilonHSYRG00183 [Hibiscus syriacus]
MEIIQKFDRLHDEEHERKLALEALVAKIFAAVSAINAGYAQLQYAQSPYDAEGIQEADGLIVSDLKKLSELKQCCLKKQYDFSPEQAMALAEIQELKSLSTTFKIMGKKLESQMRLKDSEIIFLRGKLVNPISKTGSGEEIKSKRSVSCARRSRPLRLKPDPFRHFSSTNCEVDSKFRQAHDRRNEVG